MLLTVSKQNAIPGPIGLPILGYYPFLGKYPMITLQKLTDKYGEVMKIKLLGENYYMLSSLETVKEAL
ncbi:cytochrome P450 2J6-like protein, partial [Leptotrombidium deliense]